MPDEVLHIVDFVPGFVAVHDADFLHLLSVIIRLRQGRNVIVSSKGRALPENIRRFAADLLIAVFTVNDAHAHAIRRAEHGFQRLQRHFAAKKHPIRGNERRAVGRHIGYGHLHVLRIPFRHALHAPCGEREKHVSVFQPARHFAGCIGELLA